jgi:hypothetical protein
MASDLPPEGGKPVSIEVERLRYICSSCESTSLQPLPYMDDRHRMTLRLPQFVEAESVRWPFRAVAAEIGLHERTVRRVVEDRLRT